MIKRSKQAIKFVKENDKKTVVKHVLSHDAHPLIQFGKYGVCGVFAVIVHQTVNYGLGYSILPAIEDNVPDELRFRNGLINNTIGFFVSGIVVYWLNRKFVFKSGRHNAVVEAFLFFLVSGLALIAGLVAFPLIFKYFALNPYVVHFSNLSFVVASALVNFIARKFIIFKG